MALESDYHCKSIEYIMHIQFLFEKILHCTPPTTSDVLSVVKIF